MGSSPGLYLFCSLKTLNFFFPLLFAVTLLVKSFQVAVGVDAFFSFFLFLLSLFIMPVVKNHSGQKHA